MNGFLRTGSGMYTVVWAALLLLTLSTYLLGTRDPGGALVMGAVLVLTLFKGQLVAWHFMGLRQVRPAWRLAMLAYLALVGMAIAGAYLIAPGGSN